MQSVDLKPQICTMKKNARLLFSLFSLPSFKGDTANLQTHDFQKHPRQLQGLESPSLSLITGVVSRHERSAWVCVEGGRADNEFERVI